MHNYHLLVSALLDKANSNFEDFVKTCEYTDKKGNVKSSPKGAYSFFKPFKSLRDSYVLPGNLKAAAIADCSRMLYAYHMSVVETKQPPTLGRLKTQEQHQKYVQTLEQFVTSTEVDEENKLRDALAVESREVTHLPLLFGNVCDASNPGVTIALHEPTNTYRAILFVDNADKTAKKSKCKITEEYKLVNIRTKQPVIMNTASAIIAPIECGFYHIAEFFTKGTPKEAKLSYRKDTDEYFLHLAFEFLPETIKPQTIMGVDRGVANICAYSVLDKNYRVTAAGYCEGQTLLDYLKKEDEYKVARQKAGHRYTGNRKRNFADKVIHLATNEVVLKAVQYKSQVYVEDLTQLVSKNSESKQKGKQNARGKLSTLGYTLSKAQYTKFLTVLTYKLQAAGLPAPKSVHAAYTSTSCPVCGCVDKGNRLSRSIFTCVSCGFAEDADINAGRMIALKGEWHWMPKADKKKFAGGASEGTYQELWQSYLQYRAKNY